MLVNELECIVYPEGGPDWHTELTQNPTWPQIERVIQLLDRRTYPFIHLHLPRTDSEADIRSLDVIGGLGEYGILAFNSRGFQRLWFLDEHRPGGSELVDIWVSDQGATFDKRHLCSDLALVLRVSKHFAEMGALDPGVDWDVWPPV